MLWFRRSDSEVRNLGVLASLLFFSVNHIVRNFHSKEKFLHFLLNSSSLLLSNKCNSKMSITILAFDQLHADLQEYCLQLTKWDSHGHSMMEFSQGWHQQQLWHRMRCLAIRMKRVAIPILLSQDCWQHILCIIDVDVWPTWSLTALFHFMRQRSAQFDEFRCSVWSILQSRTTTDKWNRWCRRLTGLTKENCFCFCQ